MCSCNIFAVIILLLLINRAIGDENGTTYLWTNGPFFDLDGGENWCRYAEQLEQYFVANGIQEDTKKLPFHYA